MNQKFLLIRRELEYKWYATSRRIMAWTNIHWWKVALLTVCVFILTQKDLSFQLNLSAARTPPLPGTTTTTNLAAPVAMKTNIQETVPANEGTLWGTILDKASGLINWETPFEEAANKSSDNQTFNVSDYAKKKRTAAQEAKRKKQLAYVGRFAKTAIGEMEKYGIPASITLAQGLIETNCGQSSLATKNNNHFGIKCFSRSCGKGHCSNFNDDSHKDFFRIYKSSWESYRAHSKLLKGKRYRALFRLNKKDYKGWARGLKKAGYATDKRYADKLIHLIEDLELYKYDR